MRTENGGGVPHQSTAARKAETATTDHGSAPAPDLAAVHRYVGPFLADVGTVPALGSPEWCALACDDRRKLAALVLAALSRIVLPADPAAELQADAEAREHKETAEAVSSAADWSALAARPSFAELQRRRAQPGPLAHTVDPDEVRRWVATGSTRTEGRRSAA